MSDQPSRRFTDQRAADTTLLGAGSEFKGDFRCGGDLTASGAVEGDADIQGSLALSNGATWIGSLRASHAILAGSIQGHVHIQEKLEIRKTARIRGSVSAKVIAIAQGAVIEGDVQVLGDKPVMHFEEKRER